MSYDVTERTIILQRSGFEEERISPEEALLVRDELMAAVVAENEHRVLRGEERSDAES